MKVPLKLNSIDQEHLQELYNAAGVARDELPYTAAMGRVCREFQDRTFKNASEAQVYGALLKYVRSGRAAKPPRRGRPGTPPERLEQAKQLRAQRQPIPRLTPTRASSPTPGPPSPARPAPTCRPASSGRWSNWPGKPVARAPRGTTRPDAAPG